MSTTISPLKFEHGSVVQSKGCNLLWAIIKGPDGEVRMSFYSNMFDWPQYPSVSVLGYNVDGCGKKGRLEPKTMTHDQVPYSFGDAEYSLRMEYEEQFCD